MKKFAIVLISLLMCLPAFAAPVSDTVDDAGLQKLYELLNRRLFHDRLLKDVTVKWDDLTARNDMGLTHCDGETPLHCDIYLDRDTHRAMRTVYQTLIHEMCHVAVPFVNRKDMHGEKFQACMLEIAQNGGMATVW